MAKIILRMLEHAGAALQAPFDPGRDYVRPKVGDAQRDFARVMGDMKQVGSDMRKVARRELRRNGK